MLATDTQKNTVFAFARDGVGTPEEFGLRLARHFAGSYDWITGARVAVESYGWERIPVGGAEHDHSFRKAGAEVRTAVVTVDGDDAHVLAGLTDLVVLKTTGSEFWGFPRDRYTTLAETRDRILATAVTARWRYTGTDLDFDAAFAGVRTALLETFASTHSLALQQSLLRDGRGGAGAVRRRRRDPDVDAEQAPLPAGPLGVRAGQPRTGRSSTTPTTGPTG